MDAKRYVYVGAIAAGVAAAGIAIMTPVADLGAAPERTGPLVAPTFKVGKGSGRLSLFGSSHEARYAEGADFEFSTEMAEGAIHPRA